VFGASARAAVATKTVAQQLDSWGARSKLQCAAHAKPTAVCGVIVFFLQNNERCDCLVHAARFGNWTN